MRKDVESLLAKQEREWKKRRKAQERRAETERYKAARRIAKEYEDKYLPKKKPTKRKK